jgi:predicted TIM-barrel fold metal-dependent hydrolase
MRLRLICCVLMVLGLGPRQASSTLTDHHQHFFSKAVTAFAQGLPIVTADDLIPLLDAAGIRRAVIFSQGYQFGNPNRPPVDDEYAKVRAENDWTSQQIARYPERLRGFCGLNPLKDYAVEEVTRSAKDPHLNYGLKMHFGNSDVDVLNAEHLERLRHVFRTANDHRMAIIVHLRTSVTRKRPYGARHARTFIDDVASAAPDVPIQIAHLAGAGGYDDPVVDEALGVFAEAAARRDPRVSRFYFDMSGVAGVGNWKERVDEIVARIRQLGVERVLYGSDGAVGENSPQKALAAFRQLPFTPDEFSVIEATSRRTCADSSVRVRPCPCPPQTPGELARPLTLWTCDMVLPVRSRCGYLARTCGQGGEG